MQPQAKVRSLSLGIIYMNLSALSFAIAYLFVKLAVDEFPFFPLVFFRFLIPLALLVVYFLFKKDSIKTKNLRVHCLRAFFVLIAQYSIFYYLIHGSLMDATALLNTAPLFIPLIEWLFLNHRIPKSTWISLSIGAIGMICLLQPGKTLFTLFSLFGLLAGFSQGCSQVIYGLNVRKESTSINLFYLYFFGTILSLIPIPFIAWKFPSISLSIKWVPENFLFILVLSLANVFNQFFRGKAYEQKKPSTLSSFLYLSVVISAFFDWYIFKREPDLLSICGAALIVLGGASKVFLRYYFLKRKHHSQ